MHDIVFPTCFLGSAGYSNWMNNSGSPLLEQWLWQEQARTRLVLSLYASMSASVCVSGLSHSPASGHRIEYLHGYQTGARANKGYRWQLRPSTGHRVEDLSTGEWVV